MIFLITVLTERRQIWGGDQSPDWQTEGGKTRAVLYNRSLTKILILLI